MRKKQLGWVGIVLVVAVAGSLAAWAAGTPEEKVVEKAVAVKLAEKSVTVFPVVITPDKGFGPDFRKRIGEVVGMLLERADMEKVQLAEAEFLPKEGEKVEQVAGAFGRFVAGRKIETPYALFAEIHGTPKTGPQAIRTIVVNTAGNVVLAEEIQKDAFAESGPMVPKDPMSCCVFIANRLREPWGLADPLRKDAPKGEVQENWRKRSGIPTDEEIAAIKERAVKLQEGLAKSSLQICPVYAFRKPDQDSTVKLAAMLADAGFASVQAAENGPDLNVQGSPNEQEVLWRTARKALAYFQEHAPSGEYVLVADFGIGRTEERVKVGAVHWMILDRQGDWVMVDYQNSHHEDFQRIDPDSVEDCLELVKVRLKKRLAEAK
ncbi:MAG: hypothetical protein GXX96_02840 [Planctomycetaceae bacterium]|nr:hypothetical protein [Planctomycetaceae bacterium]